MRFRDVKNLNGAFGSRAREKQNTLNTRETLETLALALAPALATSMKSSEVEEEKIPDHVSRSHFIWTTDDLQYSNEANNYGRFTAQEKRF